MASVLVDGKQVELAPGERINGIQAAERAGVEVPHYCWHAGLTVVASCRMCLVETGTRNAETGAITMMPKLSPACQTPATDNSVFVTTSEKVKRARAMVEEDLLIDHPIDCPICDKAGECLLQDYHFEHGQSERRADVNPFHSRRRDVGDTVTLFVDRCIMCTRCVRFTREIAGTSELMVINRGHHEEIDIFPGYPLSNKLSGNVVDLCPVGALGDKDFLYQQRVWFMKKHAGICTGCSTGCNIHVEENQDHVYRVKPRTNMQVNQWWMCDEGRYGFHHVHSPKRLTEPRVKQPDGKYKTTEWSDLFIPLEAALEKAGKLAAVLSPHLTVEEAYLLAKYVRGLDAEAIIALGPVPVEGHDEVFPKGFTIRAEKCPNRRGVEAVVSHFMHAQTTFEDVLEAAAKKEIKAAWLSGGYKTDWVTADQAATLRGLETLVVQDMFTSPVHEVADFQLPGAAFAERDGSYVNFADRLQSVVWAVRPPAGVRTEASVYWTLLGGLDGGGGGLYRSRRVLDEVAGEIGYFAAAGDKVSSVGVDLKVNLLAGAVG